MDDKDVKSKKQNISLGRAMLILEKMVSYRKPMRLLDIANDSGLSSSTVYRFLNAFIECGYVKRNDEAQTYSLGYPDTFRRRHRYVLRTTCRSYIWIA